MNNILYMNYSDLEKAKLHVRLLIYLLLEVSAKQNNQK